MTTTIDIQSHDYGEGSFHAFSTAVVRRFETLAGRTQPVFTCDAGDLYSIYLDNLPANERQHHTCHCCRQFIERFGNLVVIDPESGQQQSVMWPGHGVAVPDIFLKSAHAMNLAVSRGKVNGVFVSNEKTWGTPVTGEWTHFAVKPDVARLHRDRLLTPYQVMAQKLQDFGTLSHGLADFSQVTVQQALSLLDTEVLYRGEKVIGPARFLFDLHSKTDGLKNGLFRRNLIWLAVATAPVGFCTPRSSMVGTLLEDIAAGKSFEDVKRSFAAKMNPLQYQRPQSPASTGNIAQAEKIVEKLGIADSLKRRYARLDEMQLLWSPKPKAEPVKGGGIFGHLRKDKQAPEPILAKGAGITWMKFASKVLPSAERIQVRMDFKMNYVGILTAVDPDAPPILQWDREDKRNPVSWYVYNRGSTPDQWKLVCGSWVDATGITLKPCMWHDEDRYAHFGKSAILILDGAQDRRAQGLSIFPETLKSELHSIRQTIEAFSKAGRLDDTDQQSANGVMLGGDDITVRVTTAIGMTEYRIDRWD